MNVLWGGLCSLQMLGFFPSQKRGSSKPRKSTPRYPHQPRMTHKVMCDLHDRDCCRAEDIQPMYPQMHPSYGLWDVWQRPRGSQVLYDNHKHTTIRDGLPGIRTWPLRAGREISEPSSPLSEKSTLSRELLLPGMSGMYLPYEEVADASHQALQDDSWAPWTFQEEVINLPKGGTMCSGCTVGWLLKLNFNRTFKNNFSVNHNVCEWA